MPPDPPSTGVGVPTTQSPLMLKIFCHPTPPPLTIPEHAPDTSTITKSDFRSEKTARTPRVHFHKFFN